MTMSTTKENSANDTFLSDWMAGKLSDHQLKELVTETDFIAYQKLRDTLRNYQVPNPDMERNYAAIKAKRIAKLDQKPTKVFPLFRYAAIAAMMVLLFGLFQLFVFSNSITTDFGKTASITLADNSHVTLNAKSDLSYPSFFRYNRTLKLKGEAFFEVEKGNTFTVETEQGKVEVVGTKFNVIARPDFFEVICYEGKVNVISGTTATLLTHGDAIRFYHHKSETWKENNTPKPTWIAGESTFKNLPLEFVIHQLQEQYNYKVQYPNALKSIRCSGSFTHQDLETALQSICIPLQLKHTANTREIIISE